MRVEADGIRDWRPLLDRLRQLPHVTAASPGIYEQVLVARGARDGCAMIKGIIPDDERTVSDICSTATPGSAKALEPAPQQCPEPMQANCRRIVLGRTWPKPIGAASATRVMLISPQGEMTPLGVMPK